MCALRRHPSALDNPKISVVIPVYNEKATIEEILRRVSENGLRKEIVIVDDCSTDGTREYLEAMVQAQGKGETWAPAHDGGDPVDVRDLRIFFQTQNQGKGAALRSGFAKTTGILFWCRMRIWNMTRKIIRYCWGRLLMGGRMWCLGRDFLAGRSGCTIFGTMWRTERLTLLSDVMTNLKLTDMETCYKVFRKEVLQGIKLKSNRFGFEPEITAKIAKGKWRIYEVPISYAGRTYEEGKKITWKDGVKALWCIFWFKIADWK